MATLAQLDTVKLAIGPRPPRASSMEAVGVEKDAAPKSTRLSKIFLQSLAHQHVALAQPQSCQLDAPFLQVASLNSQEADAPVASHRVRIGLRLPRALLTVGLVAARVVGQASTNRLRTLHRKHAHQRAALALHMLLQLDVWLRNQVQTSLAFRSSGHDHVPMDGLRLALGVALLLAMSMEVAGVGRGAALENIQPSQTLLLRDAHLVVEVVRRKSRPLVVLHRFFPSMPINRIYRRQLPSEVPHELVIGVSASSRCLS